MPTLKFADQASSSWITLPTTGPSGPPGSAGASGPPGPTAVSTDAGNVSTLGTDGLIYTPTSSRKFTTLIGDGTATTFTITHNLASQDVIAQVYDGKVQTTATVTVVDNNSITVAMQPAPAASSIKVVVLG